MEDNNSNQDSNNKKCENKSNSNSLSLNFVEKLPIINPSELFIRETVKTFLKTYNTKNHKSNNNKQKFLKFTRCDFFKLFLFCKSFKSKDFRIKEMIFNKAEYTVYGYLDILNFTKFYEDFQKLKSLILNENQVIAFEFLNNRNFEDIINLNFNKQILKTYKYFCLKISDPSLCNSYDKKILNKLNCDFKKTLEKISFNFTNS